MLEQNIEHQTTQVKSCAPRVFIEQPTTFNQQPSPVTP
jgi:hypothetical protein